MAADGRLAWVVAGMTLVYSETGVSAPEGDLLHHGIASAHCICPSKPKSVAIFR